MTLTLAKESKNSCTERHGENKKERQYIYTPSSSSSTSMLASSERTVRSLTFSRAGRESCDVVRTKTVLQSCTLS